MKRRALIARPGDGGRGDAGAENFPNRPQRERGWWPLLIAAGVYAIVAVVVVVLRAEESPSDGTLDFRDFWLTAKAFRETGAIRDDLGVHNYLPFFVIFMTPWSLLPLWAAAALFTVLSLLLFGLTVAMAELLVAGRVGPRPRAATLAAIGLALPYVHATIVLGQVNLLLLALLVAGCLLISRGREWQAGIPLGLAVLIKVLPVVLLVVLLAQRRWRAVLASVLVAGALGLGTPLATLGWSETVRQHQEYRRRAIDAHSAWATLTSEKPIKAKYSNNALPMVVRRWLSPVDCDPREGRPGFSINVLDWPPAARVAVFAAIATLVGVLTLLAALRRPGRAPPVAGEGGAHLGFAAGCGLMLAASPLVWTHYLVLAYWPLAVLTNRAMHGGRRGALVARIALVAWVLAIAALAWPAARAAGAQLGGVLALWAVCAWLALGREQLRE